MKPNLQVLPSEILPRVIEEALELHRSPGVKVGSPEAIDLLHSSGAQINLNEGIVQIPEELILNALETVPRNFYLFNADGDPAVHYADNEIHLFGHPREHLSETSAASFQNQALFRSLDHNKACPGFCQSVGITCPMIQCQPGYMAGFEGRYAVALARQLGNDGGAHGGFTAVL